MYWKYDRNLPITSRLRFPCGGPDVTLELYPVSSTLLVFSATGVISGRRTTLTIVQQTASKDGWLPGGGTQNDGIILKRMVSIAQSPYSTALSGSKRWTNGSYFGLNGPEDRTPRIVWRTCEIGRLFPPRIVPQYRRWASAETWRPSTLGIYTDWPPTKILENSVGVCDATAISLRND
jgi:hypothetical protein